MFNSTPMNFADFYKAGVLVFSELFFFWQNNVGWGGGGRSHFYFFRVVGEVIHKFDVLHEGLLVAR